MLVSRRRPVGVYWGRFNPPHRGHLRVVRRFRDRYRLVVAIGSSEHSNERSDPFSGAERKAMFEAYLREEGIRGVRVVPLNDGPSASWALDLLVRRCRPDLLLLSTEKDVLTDLAERRLPVVRFARNGTVSSTQIRDAIAAGNPRWKSLTGRSVARLIVRWDGVGRIRRAYGLLERNGTEPPRPDARTAPREPIVRATMRALPKGRKARPRRLTGTGPGRR